MIPKPLRSMKFTSNAMQTELTGKPVVEMRNVSKRFGSLRANREVSLAVMGGEIHALVGENGAGKSTLMKILYGHFPPDSGTIRLNGEPVRFRHPREALKAGIGMVHQQLLIFPQLTALENVIVGSEPMHRGLIDRRRALEKVAEIAARFGFNLPMYTNAGQLSFAFRQQIELLRALYRGSKVLILDEPTSLLAPFEVDRFLDLLTALRRTGHTIILISHRLREVFAAADRVSVLRRGKLIRTEPIAGISREEVADLIVHGESRSAVDPQSRVAVAEVSVPSDRTESPKDLLVLDNLTADPSGNDIGLESFSLRIAAGEIVGLGGVVGNGLSTLARAIFGMAAIRSGTVCFDGRDFTALSIRDRIDAGIRRLPSNPMEEALLPECSLVDNFLLGSQRSPAFQRYGLLRKQAAAVYAARQLEIQKVRYEKVSRPVSSLSGGNQQKVALARVLAGPVRFVVLEQPGRGLDLKARVELGRRTRALNRAGVAFLVISHDSEELLTLCDRVGIVYRGRLAGITPIGEASPELLARWMLGVRNGEHD